VSTIDQALKQTLEKNGGPMRTTELASQALRSLEDKGVRSCSLGEVKSKIWEMVSNKQLVFNRERLIALPSPKPDA